MAISNDLRIRLVGKVASGMSCRGAAAHFDVSPSSAIRFVQRYAEEGTVAVKHPPPRKRRLDPYGDDILRWTLGGITANQALFDSHIVVSGEKE